MTTPVLYRSGTAFACLLLSLTLASCDAIFDKTDPRCGPRQKTTVEVVTKHNDPGSRRDFDKTYIRADQMQTELDGNIRRFRVRTDILGVCTHEHAKVKFSASYLPNSQLDLTVTARADWGLLFGTDIPLERKVGQAFIFWKSQEIDIGLEQVYEDGPGLYFVTFEVFFPTLGNVLLDRTWLEDSFGFSAVLETTYFEHVD